MGCSARTWMRPPDHLWEPKTWQVRRVICNYLEIILNLIEIRSRLSTISCPGLTGSEWYLLPWHCSFLHKIVPWLIVVHTAGSVGSRWIMLGGMVEKFPLQVGCRFLHGESVKLYFQQVKKKGMINKPTKQYSHYRNLIAFRVCKHFFYIDLDPWGPR